LWRGLKWLLLLRKEQLVQSVKLHLGCSDSDGDGDDEDDVVVLMIMITIVMMW
jgi:hypothetical protein